MRRLCNLCRLLLSGTASKATLCLSLPPHSHKHTPQPQGFHLCKDLGYSDDLYLCSCAMMSRTGFVRTNSQTSRCLLTNTDTQVHGSCTSMFLNNHWLGLKVESVLLEKWKKSSKLTSVQELKIYPVPITKDLFKGKTDVRRWPFVTLFYDRNE